MRSGRREFFGVVCLAAVFAHTGCTELAKERKVAALREEVRAKLAAGALPVALASYRELAAALGDDDAALLAELAKAEIQAALPLAKSIHRLQPEQVALLPLLLGCRHAHAEALLERYWRGIDAVLLTFYRDLSIMSDHGRVADEERVFATVLPGVLAAQRQDSLTALAEAHPNTAERLAQQFSQSDEPAAKDIGVRFLARQKAPERPALPPLPKPVQDLKQSLAQGDAQALALLRSMFGLATPDAPALEPTLSALAKAAHWQLGSDASARRAAIEALLGEYGGRTPVGQLFDLLHALNPPKARLALLQELAASHSAAMQVGLADYVTAYGDESLCGLVRPMLDSTRPDVTRSALVAVHRRCGAARLGLLRTAFLENLGNRPTAAVLLLDVLAEATPTAETKTATPGTGAAPR
jgi:hypothetical protein